MSSKRCNIAQLIPARETWRVPVRCVHLWATYSYTRPNERSTIEMVFEDEEKNQIQATIRNYFIANLEARVVEGGFYILSNFEIRDNDDDYRATSHAYRLFFHNHTVIRTSPPLNISRYGFSLVDFADIHSNDVKDTLLIDVLGEVTECENLADPDNNGNVRCTAKLVDLNGENIHVTLWNTYANRLVDYWKGGHEGPVIVILQNAMIKTFRGRYLQNSMYASRLFLNDDIPEINIFRKSVEANGREFSERSFSRQTRSEASENATEDFDSSLPVKTIAELDEITEEGYFVVLGTIVSIQTAYNWYYTACKKHHTKIDGDVTVTKCRVCKKPPPQTTTLYKLTIKVMDETGSASFVLFDPQLNPLIGKTAAELKKYLDENDESFCFPDELDYLLEKRFLFKIDINKYTLQQRTKLYTVSRTSDSPNVIRMFCNYDLSSKETNSEIGDSACLVDLETPTRKRTNSEQDDVGFASEQSTSRFRKVKLEKIEEMSALENKSG